jgi:multimeric flavodoxin WrbA
MENQKTVLGIVSSPHNSRSGATLVKAVLKGAESKGFRTELICLGDLRINPLIPSSSREPYEVTGPDDDMKLVFHSLERMSAFVFGVPVYFDHVNDRAKIFLDRLIYYARKKERFPKNVPAAILLTYAYDVPSSYDSVVDWIKHVLEYYRKMQVIATLQVEGVETNPVANRNDLLDKAKHIGISLCERLLLTHGETSDERRL